MNDEDVRPNVLVLLRDRPTGISGVIEELYFGASYTHVCTT